MESANENPLAKASRIGLLLGPLVALAIVLFGAPESLHEGESGSLPDAWITLALLVLMAIWWVTEAVPIPVTSLLPLVVLPLFEVSTMAEAAAPYMHPIVVLLMGGFIFAKAIEHWGLHERIALHVVNRAGGSPVMIVGGFMLAAAVLSMWISNSATAIMMMPIALSVAAAVERGSGQKSHNFTFALLLGIAYACSIGGLGTPIGTPTNLIVMGYINEKNGVEIGFAQWMMIGIPVVLLLLPLAWFTLTRWAFQVPKTGGGHARDAVLERLKSLGGITKPERRTLILFAVIAGLWMFRRPLNTLEFSFAGESYLPLSGLTDHLTAVIAVVLCFIVPAGLAGRPGEKLLNWQIAERIPWGVLLLFGGGMSLAHAISSTGLSAHMGSSLAVVASYPIPVLIFLVAVAVLALTEVTSNIATASALMPVLGAIVIETGLPISVMAAPLALAASCAFMLPMATGPNAVVFATGEVSLATMAKTGLRLNIIAVFVITFVSYYFAPYALGE